MARKITAFKALLKRIRTNTLTPEDTDTNGVLNLNNKDFKDANAIALAKALEKAPPYLPITKLVLSKNQINTAGAKALAVALKKNKSLKQIDLNGNWIGDAGAKHIADALEHNITLTQLYISGNNISQALLTRINGYLERNRKLAAARDKEFNALLNRIRNNILTGRDINEQGELDLSEWEITDKYAESLAEALENAPPSLPVTKLVLSNNRIGNTGAKALARVLEKNKALIQIGLSNNQIGTEGTKALAKILEENNTLSQIGLSDNQIGAEGAKALAGALEKNNTLSQIGLSNNQIGAAGAKALARALEKNNALIQIDLSWNEIGEKGTKALAEALEENNTLIQINLSWNGIEDKSAKALAVVLKKNKSLKQIDLNGNWIGDAGADALADALEHNTSLTSLNISDNNIKNKAVLTRINGYLERNRKLAATRDKEFNALLNRIRNNILTGRDINEQGELDLSEWGITDKYAESLTEALENAPPSLPVTKLVLSNNQIGNAGAKALAGVLEKNKSLKQIDLNDNWIEDAGADALADALEHNTSLTSLNISDNNIKNKAVLTRINSYLERNRKRTAARDKEFNALLNRIRNNILTGKDINEQGELDLSEREITDKYAESLAEALEKAPPSLPVTKLVLSNNQIGNAGAKALARVLEKNKTLIQIYLGDNNIEPVGAKDIAKAIQNNNTLIQIDLSYNNIGNEGTKDIAKAIQNNDTLTQIDLSYNNIGDAGAKHIADALEHNTTLTQLYISGNNISQALLTRINGYLERNRKLAAARDKEFNALLNRIRNNILTGRDINEQGELDLSEREITDKYAESLAEALENAPPSLPVTKLVLSNNRIGNAGAKALARVLEKNKALTQIDINGNRIGVKGAEHIAKMLENNKNLTQIDLSDNQIGDEGAKALAQILGKNNAFSLMDLGHKLMVVMGAKTPAKVIEQNKTLTHIDLRSNQIGDAGAKHIADALEHNTSLTSLNISDNNIKNKAVLTRINGYLERNRKLAAAEAKAAQNIPVIEVMSEPRSVEEHSPEIEEYEEAEEAVAKPEIDTRPLAKLPELVLDEEEGFEIDNTEKKDETLDLKDLKTKIDKLDTKIDKLDTKMKSKADFSKFDALQKTMVTQEEFKKWVTTLENTDITEELKELRELLQTLQPDKDTSSDMKQLETQMQQVRGFMHEHAEQLGLLSNEAKAKALANQELQTLLSTPQAKEYGYTLVATLNQLYLVGSILQTPYFEAEGKTGKGIGGVFKLVGRLLPVGGNYVDLLSNPISHASKKANARSFGRFVGIAKSPEGMHQISQKILLGLARELGTEKLGTARCKVHIKYLTAFLMSDTLEKLDPPVERLEELVSMLVHVAQRGDLKGYERQAGSLATTSNPASDMRDKKPQHQNVLNQMKTKLKKRREQTEIDDEDDETMTLASTDNDSETTSSIDVDRISPKLLEFLRRLEQQDMLEALETLVKIQIDKDKKKEAQNLKRKVERNPELIKELQRKIESWGNKKGLMKPQNDVERHTEMLIITRLMHMNEIVFGDVKLDKRIKANLKMDLQAALVDRALRNDAFKKAFLSDNEEKRGQVGEKLAEEVKEAAKRLANNSQPNTKTEARKIADNLEIAITNAKTTKDKKQQAKLVM